MPLFKIESAGRGKFVIKANNLEEIVAIGREKLKLLENVNYKLVLSNDKTEIDDDIVLLEYAALVKEPLILSFVNPDEEVSVTKDMEENTENVANNNQSSLRDAPSTSNKPNPQAMNLEIGVWNRVLDSTKKKCEEEKRLDDSERRALIRIIVDYMINTLKTTKRNVASEIAKSVCNKYPKSFDDSINYHESWGGGQQSLFLQIYNAVIYKKSKDKAPKQAGVKRSLQPHDDSDDEAQTQREEELESRRKQDEYGCVNYAPLLSGDETPETQEAARVKLVELFSSDKSNDDIGSLMKQTYPTLRATINDTNVNLELIPEKWPFIQMTEYFLHHSSHLLDKDINKIWTESAEKRIKITGQYLKSLKLKDEIKNKLEKFVNEAKTASLVRKDRMSKYLVVFRLLLLFFNEDEKYFFKVKQNDEGDESEDTTYPILVIEGTSLYDERAKCFVCITEKFIIQCNDPLQGILVNFLSFYVFGLSYHTKISKTLEFIQRIYLRINPPTKGGKNKKKRQLTPYNPTVYTLAKRISQFSDEFQMGEE